MKYGVAPMQGKGIRGKGTKIDWPALMRFKTTLPNFDGRVSDSGEGQWTIKAAIDEAEPAPVDGKAAIYAIYRF